MMWANEYFYRKVENILLYLWKKEKWREGHDENT